MRFISFTKIFLYFSLVVFFFFALLILLNVFPQFNQKGIQKKRLLYKICIVNTHLEALYDFKGVMISIRCPNSYNII